MVYIYAFLVLLQTMKRVCGLGVPPRPHTLFMVLLQFITSNSVYINISKTRVRSSKLVE